MTKKLPIFPRPQLLANVALLLAIIIGVSSCSRFQVKQANDKAVPTPQELNNFPKREGLLNDYADVLDKVSEDRVTKLLAELNQSKGIETVIVVVKNTGGEPIFDYSLRLANQWRIGSNGRGVLFVLSIDDRQWRIQVSRALENVLTNEVTKVIGDRSADFFKKQEYVAGIESFVKNLESKLDGS